MCAQITFDRGDYIGKFSIHDMISHTDVTPEFTFPEPQSPVTLADGRRYSVNISPGAGFGFHISDGAAENPESKGLSCTGTTVRFNTGEVHIVPANFEGTFEVTNVPFHANNRVRLLIDLRSDELDGGYIVNFAPSCAIRFNLDANEMVTLNNHYTGAGKGGHGKLHFDTARIEVEPDDPTVPWSVRNVDRTAVSGTRALRLVPCVPANIPDRGYILDVAGSNGRFGTLNDGAPDRPEVVVSTSAGDRRFRLSRR